MRRKWLAVIVLVFGFRLAEGAAPVDLSQSQSQAAVAHLEREWLRALNHADVDTIARILGNDFVRPAPQTGQFTGKADLLRYYRSHLVPLKAGTKQIEDMTVTVYGGVAIARGEVVTRNAQGAAQSTLLFTDVFVQRSGGWQAVSAQESPVTGH